MVRGLIDAADDFVRDDGVPLGVLAGATLVRDVPADHLLTYDDVELLRGLHDRPDAPHPGGDGRRGGPGLDALRESLAR